MPTITISDKIFTEWKAVLDSCKDLLQKSASILHANNIYLVRVLDAAFCAAIEVEKFELAAKYGARTLDPYRYENWFVLLLIDFDAYVTKTRPL
ncbi:hypothetical protein DPMN_067220 [Dreissena polymorpha]|uniref:Uncharacterized protein n=1 Tax=Dreissena polymorpha TaxID=45954 RepID=A0A9D3Z0D2_DREPO|nr:hypothetical protein DPMN_067220 [Dreissena polymorpha]